MVAYRNILPSLTQEERAEQHRQAAEEEVERSRTASLNTSRDSTQFPNSGPNSAHAQPVNWMGTSMGIHLPQQLTDQQLGFGQQPDLNQQLRHIGMFGDMGFDPQQQPGQQPDFNQQQQQQSHHSQQIDYHNQSHQSQDLGQGQQGDGSHQFGYAPMVHFDGMPMQSETDFHQQIHNNSLWSGVPGSHPYTMGMLTGNSVSRNGMSMDQPQSPRSEIPQPQYGLQMNDEQSGLHSTNGIPATQARNVDVPGFRLLTNTALTNPGLADIQDNTLQQSQANTIYGQPGHARGVSEDNAGHFSSISSESQVAIRPQSSEESSPSELPTNNAPTPPGAPAPASGPTLRKGPLSKPVELPPKPRPGRKPMPNGQANDRRKEQNRQAQRNFRDKRAMKVKELEGDLSDLKGKAETQERILTNKLHDQKQRNAALVKENEGLRRALDASNNRNSELERQIRERAAQSMANARFNASVQRVGTSSGLPPLTSQHAGVDENIHRASSGAIVTPPIDAGYNSMFPTNDMNNNTGFEMETDFTNYLRGTNNVAQNAPQNNVDSDNMDYVHDGVTCGFCTDTSNCVCAAKSRPVVAPGGCDACVRDPERAAACKALADQTQVSQRPTEPTNNNTEHRHDSMAQPQNMISCSSLIDRLGGRRIPSIRELVPGTVHSYVPSRHPGAGYDVDEQEVAHVLQSMSGRNTEINMGL